MLADGSTHHRCTHTHRSCFFCFLLLVCLYLVLRRHVCRHDVCRINHVSHC